MTGNGSQTLKEQIDSALLTCMADIPSDEVPKWEAAGTRKLKELAEEHGAEKVIRCVKDAEHDVSFELYFLARAGISEVVPHLKELLESEDADVLSSAVTGLIALDHQTGWDILEAILNGKYREILADPLYWYFHEELERIGTAQALDMLEQIKNHDGIE